MKLDAYLQELGKLSEVKTQILTELWNENPSEFPRGWVSSAKILELTNQKYFDRRIRELRDQDGCDIETGFMNGKSAYRLLSAEIKPGAKRAYLSEKQKKQLYHSQNYQCQICNKQLLANTSGSLAPQADHKVPLSRNGSHEIDNWQTICVECNVGKRRACQGCEADCFVCPWAFPEKTGVLVNIAVPKELFNKLAAHIESQQVTDVQAFILKLLNEKIAEKN